jgi:UDP-GlcNAc:undecaprenyl-phosphate GlcNAc-1-phosphate transferase
MAHITVERILKGKVRNLKEWIDYVGKDHLHHRICGLIGDRRKTVLLIYSLSATFGLSAIVLKNARTIDCVVLVIQALLITLIVSILEYSGRNHD